MPGEYLETFMKRRCHDCNVQPGQAHEAGCDTEQCSACGGQRLQCECPDHDPAFARWSGFWPGKLEAGFFPIDLNRLHEEGIAAVLFKKPDARRNDASNN